MVSRTTRYLFFCFLLVSIVTLSSASETILTAEEIQAKKDEEKRLWGSSQQQPENTQQDSTTEASSTTTPSNSNDKKNNNNASVDSSSSSSTTTTSTSRDDSSTATQDNANPPSPSTIPFVSKSQPSTSSGNQNSNNNINNNANIPQQHHHYAPPEGFQITARVYTDPKDKLSHFDFDTSIKLPYWECGVSGSTTVPLPLQHGSIRHLLAGSKPTRFRGDEYGPHPQLVVALTAMEIILDSGATHTFESGDVVLLEDVVRGGHKLQGHANQDMTVMIVTMPQTYHQVGKDKLSLQKFMAQLESPCATDGDDPSKWGTRMGDALTKTKRPNRMAETMRSISPRSIRQYILGVVGVSASALLGDFMGKVAPLWVAVVFGGGCFVAGGTFAFVKVGDYLLEELQLWQERRQLRLKDDEENENERPISPSSTDNHQRERFEGMNAQL
jgi:hypothetical protein